MIPWERGGEQWSRSSVLGGSLGKWRLCYLVIFGSTARGYSGLHSDVDVAVRAGRRLDLIDRGLLIGEFEECWGRRVDLVVLEDWNPIIAWEALTRGVLVYASSRECERRYYEDKARAIKEVGDLEPLIRMFAGELSRAFSRASRMVHKGAKEH